MKAPPDESGMRAGVGLPQAAGALAPGGFGGRQKGAAGRLLRASLAGPLGPCLHLRAQSSPLP